MAAKSSPASGAPAAKKSRGRSPKYFIGSVYATEAPVVVISHTQKAALAALVTLSHATPQEVVKALQSGNKVLDTTTPAQTRVDEAA